MLRRRIPCLIILMVVSFCVTLDSRTSTAQGLLRRIQNRIQSRAVPPTPRQPVSPTASGAARTASGAVRTSSGAVRTPSNKAASNAKSQASKLNQFGPSILSRPGQTPTSPIAPTSGKSASGKSASVNSVATENSAAEIGIPTPNATGTNPPRPSLGIDALQATAGIPGISVTGFREDSRADEAGLRKGDVIIAIDKQPTPTIADVARMLDQRKVGDTVEVRVMRGQANAAPTNLTLRIPLLGPLLASNAAGNTQPIAFGANVAPQRGVRGVVVSKVEQASPASAAGLQVGDRIVSLDGRLTSDVATFQRELVRHADGESFAVGVVRDNRMVQTQARLVAPKESPITSAIAGTGADADGKTTATKNGSVLNGIGSMLGGLFGGGDNANTAHSPKNELTLKNELPPKDEMALEDDEPVRQVGFDEEVVAPSKKIPGDPPSLEKLELPAGEASPIESVEIHRKASPKNQPAETADEIREQIRRLQERLKQIESESTEPLDGE